MRLQRSGLTLTTLAILTAALALRSDTTVRAGQMSAAGKRHANRGVALLEQFDFDQAAVEFEALVAMEPDSAPGYINLGIAYFNQRDFERARLALEKALALAPDIPHVHYNLGLIYKLSGETEQAVAAFERVAAIDLDNSMTHYYLGTLYANLNRLDDAVRSLERAIALQPNNESAHFSLGNVLIRQGKREEGRRELMAFRELKESFPAEAASAGLQYTELGKYAEALESSAEPLQPLQPEERSDASVRFVESTEQAGLSGSPLEALEPSTGEVSAEAYNDEWIFDALRVLGTGLAFRDLNGDDTPDLLFVRGGAPRLYWNRGARFEVASESGLPRSGKYVGAAIGDVDNDGDGDVYLSGVGPNALYLNDGGRFTEASEAGVAGSDVSVSVSFADVDHDGDLDLYVSNFLASELPIGATVRVPEDLPGAPNRLYRNNGNGSFAEVARETRTAAGAHRTRGSLFSDLDDDRDIDFIVVNDGHPAQVFSNDRVGTFTESARVWGLETTPRIRGVDAADFDRDGSFDVFLTAGGSALNSLLRGPARDGLRPDVLSPGLLAAGVTGARYGASFFDADNDTDLDLVLVVNEPGTIAAYYQNTGARFERAFDLPADLAEVGEGRALAIADTDQDGDLDVVVGTVRGSLLHFANEGDGENGFLRVRARGLRSNLDGIGAKVEVKAGDASLRREVRSASGYFSQNDLPLHFGLGEVGQADYVRFLWPGGVKQIEMDVAGGQTASVEELNRKGTSCPILYAWDGEGIRFVTDFLGGSAIGNLLAPGQFNYPDTAETIKMEAFPLVARDGRFEMRWVNQLEEVIIYDKASLLVVDHPGDIDVFPNERLMPGPPYPESRLYPVRDKRPPAAATDHRGSNVLELVRHRDRRFPSDFELSSFKGYAGEHSLTLDLGVLAERAHTVLLLYGWVDYADSSSNLAASQAELRAVTPYLEVGDRTGNFSLAIEQMGFPAGLPKTMIVDLEGIVGPHRNVVRITTNMRLYWDQILVATVAPGASLELSELSPSEARLRFRGYPAPYNPDGRQPSLYTYSEILPAELWGAHEGYYTRYGDVRPLLESIDDRYVVTHHGDEVLLTFEENELPKLPDGWSRTFLAFADGFGKDMDLNSARPHAVAPLPFHDMSSYPYPSDEHYPRSAEHQRYLETYNTRYVGPERRTPFPAGPPARPSSGAPERNPLIR